MRKYLFILFLPTLIYFSACNQPPKGVDGGVVYSKQMWGDSLCINETEYFQTLFPHAIVDAVSQHVGSQIFEGLLCFNPKELYILPSLAERWIIDSLGTTFTFFIKKNIKFHDDPCFKNGQGREITAQDFSYCFHLLCTQSENNKVFETTFKNVIVGANEYYEASAKGKPDFTIEGIKVLDKYVLQIKITRPNSTFLSRLALIATTIFPEEGYLAYGANCRVGTGPFIYKKNTNEAERLVLLKNPNYHVVDSSGKHLPYLDKICFSFLPDKKQELAAFKQNQLDVIIGLPPEQVKQIVEKEIKNFEGDSAIYVLERIPEMITHFFEFNVTRPPFTDVRVRQAFNYAIDRNKIIETVLNNEAYGPGEFGLIPPAFRDYNVQKIKGYTYDPEKAKKLMAEAGYPGGKGFPTFKILLNSGGRKNTSVAFEVQKQLTNTLGVTTNVDVVSFSEKITEATNGTVDIFKNALGADYPNPESFLWSFYGKTLPRDSKKPSFPNTSRYYNAQFDMYFESGKEQLNEDSSYNMYAKAEQLLMNDAPIIVLWYDESYQLKHSAVKNLFINPLRYRNYTWVYKTK